MSAQADAKIERWRQRLLDLSRRNRLLYFKPTRQTIRITAPAPADLFFQLVVKERTLKFPVHVRDEDLTLSDETDTSRPTAIQVEQSIAEAAPQAPVRSGHLTTNLAAHDLARVLHKTRLQARSALEERGVNSLFVAAGMLEWKESDTASETVKSPLILIPVQLEQLDKDRMFPLAPFDDDVTVNPTLAFLMKREFGIELPPLPEDPVSDTFTQWIADVQQLVLPHGWKVPEESWLGQFSFLKMAMVRDLEAYRDQIVLHPVAGALAGAHDLPIAANDAPTAEDLDRSPKPAELFPVLDADSSQMDVLSHSVAGHNLIIDGPPGTGKSQTIANIIAALLAHGKKVLFVSEKMAALEVVKKRLDDAGLGAFCLEAHSHRANKREVIAQLARSLQDQDAFLKPDQATPQRFAELRQRRDQLNGYVAALHEPRDQYGRTTFAMHGKLAKLTALPDRPFDIQLPVNLLHLTVDQWEAMNGAVRRMAGMTGLLQDYHEHPWRGSTITTFSLGLQDQLRMQFRSFAQLVDEIAAASGDVARLCGLPAPHTLETIERLITVARLASLSPYPPACWFTEESLLPLVQSATAYRERFDKWHTERQELMRLYTPVLIELDCARLAQRLGPAHTAALALVDPNPGTAVPRAVEQRAVIHDGLAKAREALAILPSELAALAAIVGQPEPGTVAGAERLIQAGLVAGSDPRPAESWLSWDSLLSVESEARGARERQAARARARAEIEQVFHPGIFDIDGNEWLQRFTSDYRGLLGSLKGGWRRDRAALEGLLRTPGRLKRETATAHLQRLTEYQSMFAGEEQRRPVQAAAFGFHFLGDNTDWAVVLQAIASVRQLLAIYNGQLPDRLAQVMTDSGEGVQVLRVRAQAAASTLHVLKQSMLGLGSALRLTGIVAGHPAYEHAPLQELNSALAWLAEEFNSLWTAHDTVERTLHSGTSRSTIELIEDVQRAARMQALQSDVIARHEELAQTYGSYFADMATSWDQVIQALGWTGQVREHFGGHPPPAEFIVAVSDGSMVPESLRAALPVLEALHARLPEECKRLYEIFPADSLLISGLPIHQASLNDLASWLRQREQAVPRLQEWADFRELQETCTRLGLEDFLRVVLRGAVPLDQIEGVFERWLVTCWLDEAYATTPVLQQFRRQEYEGNIDRFCTLDQELRSARAADISSQLRTSRPRIGGAVQYSYHTELRTLAHETNKKIRHIPLRRLFSRIPHLLLDLKPCLLMSPLSVAYYLPMDDFTFDVLIFDEASQILPEDAVGSILRARQVIVAGDEHQLPPSAYFTAEDEVENDDDEEDVTITPLESLLLESKSLSDAHIAFRNTTLLWHYRSRDEMLIAFSNQHYYKNRLITFPPVKNSGIDTGIRFEHVPDGIWDRGKSRTNVPEARRVARLVFEHFAKWGTDRSLGIIALNHAQADRIYDEVRALRNEDRRFEPLFAEDRLEPFFVKALENVQGDERDAIILSLGYGPDAKGVITMNFGPINRAGGERRLNVAVTRARQQLTLVTSMQPEQIKPPEAKGDGNSGKSVALLQAYLYFARDGRLPAVSEPSGRGPESPFEEAVIEALRARGLDVVPQVGCSGFRIDIGIRHRSSSDRFILGVECDGATYHRARTARDRDRLRQQVLEGLGWRIHRIWSADWARDPVGETQRVLNVIDAAMSLAAPPPAPPQPSGVAHSEADPAHPITMEEPPLVPAVAAPSALWPAVEHRDTGALDQPLDSGAERGSHGPPAIAAISEQVLAEPPANGGEDVIYYRPFVPQVTHLPEALLLQWPNRIAAEVMQVVEAEGPIRDLRLINLVARMYGITQVDAQQSNAVKKGITEAIRMRMVQRKGRFLWPPGMEHVTPRRTPPDVTGRPLDEICPEEILAAAQRVVAEHPKVQLDRLAQETARWLGLRYTGPGVLKAIHDQVRQVR